MKSLMWQELATLMATEDEEGDEAMFLRRGPRDNLPEMMRAAIEGRTRDPYAWACDGHLALVVFQSRQPKVADMMEAINFINGQFKTFDQVGYRVLDEIAGELPLDVLDSALRLGGIPYALELLDAANSTKLLRGSDVG